MEKQLLLRKFSFTNNKNNHKPDHGYTRKGTSEFLKSSVSKEILGIILSVIVLHKTEGIRIDTNEERVHTISWKPIETHSPAMQISG